MIVCSFYMVSHPSGFNAHPPLSLQIYFRFGYTEKIILMIKISLLQRVKFHDLFMEVYVRLEHTVRDFLCHMGGGIICELDLHLLHKRFTDYLLVSCN